MTTTKTIPQAPFKVGDRVRKFKCLKKTECPRGVIVSIGDNVKRYDGSYTWFFRVKRDNGRWCESSHNDVNKYGRNAWELEPDREILIDHNADLLIKAYQEGDKTALRPLIDRLLELL